MGVLLTDRSVYRGVWFLPKGARVTKVDIKVRTRGVLIRKPCQPWTPAPILSPLTDSRASARLIVGRVSCPETWAGVRVH